MMAETSDVVGVVDEKERKVLERSRSGLKECIVNERDQREKMLDDLRFATLDQWPQDIRSQRENDVVNGPRPCLTIDQINQYITQVANDMRKNRPSIKTRPVDDVADPETAKIFQGLVRHIEDQSSAQIAYETAGESAATIGLGFFRVVAEYASPDSFDQELRIKRVPDTFSVYLGQHVMPDGSDASEGWVFERLPIEKFKREYPDAKYDQADFAGLDLVPAWKSDTEIMVCEYFYKSWRKEELLFLADGTTQWKSDYESAPDPKQPVMDTRESDRCQLKWVKHTGCEVLDKRDLPGDYIPIVEVVGKEKSLEGKRILWGLVRPAKDSLRAFNYWISAMTEKMALAPKAPFIGAVGQFATFGDKWDQANVNNYAKLEYDAIDVNGNAVPPPRRQEPMQMEPAMAQMLQIMQNNVKSSLGMYKAALGETESQQSGRAILALQRESDTGTMHFGENQALSVTHAGRILVNLIPYYYDTKRVLRILGEDGKVQAAQIDPNQKEPMRQIRQADGSIRKIYNLGVGKYDVTVTVGPSFATSRQEASTVMTDLANTAKDPISAAILRYGAIKNSEFSGSEEIVRMLKAMLPPQVQQTEGEQEPIPAAAQQKIAQLTQASNMMKEGLQKLGAENMQLKTGAAEAQAKIQADAKAAADKLAVQQQADLQADQLEREKFDREQELARYKINKEAETKVIAARIAAKCSTDTAYIQAEAKDNVELSTPEMTPEMEDGSEQPPMRPMDKLAALHGQSMQQHASSMDQLATMIAQQGQFQQQALAMIAQAIAAPRTVQMGQLRRDNDGRIV